MRKVIALLCLVLLIACTKEDGYFFARSDKALLSFGFLKADNPALNADCFGTIDGTNVSVTISTAAKNLSNLKATFTSSSGSTVIVAFEIQQDRCTSNSYVYPVMYTVVAEDGSCNYYAVVVNNTLSAEKDVLGFSFQKSENPLLGYDVPCRLNSVQRKIMCSFPEVVSRRKLIPTFSLSPHAWLNISDTIQVSGQTARDYTTPSTVRVFAEDSSYVDYEIEFTPELDAMVDYSCVFFKLREFSKHRSSYANITGTFSEPQIVILSPSDFQAQKPANTLPFECGFIGSDQTLYVSKPVFALQTEVFSNIDQVALYYLSQLYFDHYYGIQQSPLWLKLSFAIFESGVRISEEAIKQSIQAYGGALPSFEMLNDTTKFRENKGIAISYLFGEFIGVYKLWGFPEILNITAQSFTTAPWVVNCETNEKLFGQWQRYTDYRINKTGDQQLLWQQESANFRYLYRGADRFNFPQCSDILEEAYAEYRQWVNISHPNKLVYITMPEADFAAIDGVESANRYTGGTAWLTGLSSTCANQASDIVSRFRHLLRHELAHSFQALMMETSTSTLPAWLNEGFPEFMAEGGPMSASRKEEVRASINTALADATNYFQHKPTWEDIKVYPNPYFNYYGLGQVMYEFVYSLAGKGAIMEITKNPEAEVRYLGYSGTTAFMNAFYAYFDLNWKQ